MWTRNVLIAAAASALMAAPAFAQQKAVASRTVAVAARDTLQSRHARRGAMKAQPAKAQASKAQAPKAQAAKADSAPKATTAKALAKHAAKHAAKRTTKHSARHAAKRSVKQGAKGDTASVRTPSSVKP